jgi:hypothetical protein
MADLHRGPSGQGGGEMPTKLTAEPIVRRISAERAHVDERGAFGTWPEPADPAALRRANPPGAGARADGVGRRGWCDRR